MLTRFVAMSGGFEETEPPFIVTSAHKAHQKRKEAEKRLQKERAIKAAKNIYNQTWEEV